MSDVCISLAKTFLEASGSPSVEKSISLVRQRYYKQAFEAILASETPQAILWPLMLTRTLSLSVLPPSWNVLWHSACVALGMGEGSFGGRLEELNRFLDSAEAMQESVTIRQAL